MSDQFLDSFKTIWKGGYFEGQPTDPMATSGYGIFGFHSSLYLVYRCCVKPFVHADTVALEIGPGRGAWTKAIADLGAKKVYAVDAVPAEYAGFWDYVGRRPNVEHFTTHAFDLAMVPDNSLDYFFSFGCFCHLKPDMCIAYINALAGKMKTGANGFLMVADYDKFNACVADVAGRSTWRTFDGKKSALLRVAFQTSLAFFRDRFVQRPLDKDEPESTDPGAWFHLGTARACQALEAAGFKVVERDMEIIHRDPVIHFVKA